MNESSYKKNEITITKLHSKQQQQKNKENSIHLL